MDTNGSIIPPSFLGIFRVESVRAGRAKKMFELSWWKRVSIYLGQYGGGTGPHFFHKPGAESLVHS